MKKFRNFQCSECNKTFERYVTDETKEVVCSNPCYGVARRVISAPKCFQNTTGKSPSAR